MDRGENDSGQQRSTMEMKMTKEHIPKGKREIAELDTHQWRTRSTMDMSMRNALIEEIVVQTTKHMPALCVRMASTRTASLKMVCTNRNDSNYVQPWPLSDELQLQPKELRHNVNPS